MLTQCQWDLLSVLRQHFGRPVNKETINHVCWDNDVVDGTLKVHVSKLRKALARTPIEIVTIWAFGYMVRPRATRPPVIRRKERLWASDDAYAG
jgi:DNA-binding response OmpR family regulator